MSLNCYNPIIIILMSNNSPANSMMQQNRSISVQDRYDDKEALNFTVEVNRAQDDSLSLMHGGNELAVAY
jgi:hypothetical protein